MKSGGLGQHLREGFSTVVPSLAPPLWGTYVPGVTRGDVVDRRLSTARCDLLRSHAMYVRYVTTRLIDVRRPMHAALLLRAAFPVDSATDTDSRRTAAAVYRPITMI